MEKNTNISGSNWFAIIGASLSVVLSWTTWHSIWWAILHGFFGWFYVIYYAINYM